jgi:hypothetical protein
MTSQEFDPDEYVDIDDGEECGNCGGEGYVYDCFDGFCMDAESGCDDCARRCDWCNRPTPKQAAETEALSQVLSDALTGEHKPKEPGE